MRLHAAEAELAVDPKDLPRLAAVPLDKALGTFEIKKGFHLEFAANEPQVVDPVTVAFDENGRMFAAEMRDYSERRDETPHLGTIRLLEDTDGDGYYEKATVYADDLPFPTAVICWNGGIFVAASPDIIWFKDTDGDGRADERKVVFTGFAAGRDKLNMQALLNSFTWGLDNRIYGATAPNGGIITSPVNPSMKPLNLNGRDFSFDPRTLEIRAEGPTAQYGMSFDDRGRKFSCSNSRHIMAEMVPPRYAGLNPHYNLPPALVDIAVDGPAAEVFRISPDEPWRIIRTRWRIAGVAKGPVEGGGRVSGYFTGATGLTIYRGNTYGPEFVGNAFIGDAGGNLVHRKRVMENGVGFVAQRPPGEEKSEFLASRDTWFRPVHFANAPDGCLYVIDMNRETIEHPWSIPEPIKKYVDLNSGNDRGRVYRIAPDGFKQPPLPTLGKATTAELVATLNHPNGWHRDTATRLLYERQDKAAVAALRKSLRDSSQGRAHIHAVHVLQGLGELTTADILAAAGSPNPGARQQAIALMESDPAKERGLSLLTSLKSDPDTWVRYQLALSLATYHGTDKVSTLASLAMSEGAGKWMRYAVLNSAAGVEVELAESVSQMSDTGKTFPKEEFVGDLLQMAGAADVAGNSSRIFSLILKAPDRAAAFSLAQSYGEGLARARSSLEKVDPSGRLQPLFQSAQQLASDKAASAPARVQAVNLLAMRGSATAKTLLLGLLDGGTPDAVQSAALKALSKSVDEALATELITRWKDLPHSLHEQTLRILLARPERVRLLLDAMEQGRVKPDVLSPSQAAQLRGHKDKTIAARAEKLFPDPAKTRLEALANFQAALQFPGDAAKGHLIYQTRCAPCHRAGKEGHPVGPDMVTMKTMGREKLLVNILDPNLEVAPQYIAYNVEKKDGESLLAVIASETGTSVTLRMPSGLETTLQRTEIGGMRSGGQSMMPEGMEAGLLIPDMADLMAFIEAQ